MKKNKYQTIFNDRKYEVHAMVYNEIRPDCSVLDLGCGDGSFAEKIKNNKNCSVFCVEEDRDLANNAQSKCTNVYLNNLDFPNDIILPFKSFDYILLLDVVEHLKYPDLIINKLNLWLKKDGKIIISTPNIVHISIRLNILFGKFQYEKYGILDNNHLHFYTKNTIVSLLEKHNYLVENIFASSDFGQIPYFGRLLKYIPKQIQNMFTKLAPSVFGVQWVLVCSKKL